MGEQVITDAPVIATPDASAADLVAENEQLRARAHEWATYAALLRDALQFYADPASKFPGAEWSDDYPGGIVYTDEGYTVLDSGNLARAALQSTAPAEGGKP